MTSRLRREQCCTVDGCLRPARELGGHCTTCWRSLSPERRDVLRWEASADAAAQDTDEFSAADVMRAAAELLELEAAFALPDAEHPPTQYGEAA